MLIDLPNRNSLPGLNNTISSAGLEKKIGNIVKEYE